MRGDPVQWKFFLEKVRIYQKEGRNRNRNRKKKKMTKEVGGFVGLCLQEAMKSLLEL